MTEEAQRKSSDEEDEEILPERTIIDMLGYTWAYAIPTPSLTILAKTKCFEKRHHLDRLVFINASKMKGLYIVDKLVGMVGRKKIFSAPEKVELDYLGATTKDPQEFFQDLKAHYGTTEVTLDQARAWVVLQGFADAIVHELQYYFGEHDLLTHWERLMLHRTLKKSAWKREIREFHKEFGVRAHPAFLVLKRAYIGGLEMPVHDRERVEKYLAPMMRDTPAQGVDFAKKEQDYHEWVAKMLERSGIELSIRKRRKLLGKKSD